VQSSVAFSRLALACLTAVFSGLSWGSSAVTSSQFAVSESGAATLTIPIQVPRGIGGMEPQLALSYSSSAGNGLVGLGWTLSGPSAITRCPKSRVLDGVQGTVTFGVGDRYCLDGQRLVVVTVPNMSNVEATGNQDAFYSLAGNTYRTERDSFSRISAVGNHAGQSTVPNSFKVETKAGLILEFGLGANSQVLTNFPAGVGTATINRWLLQRISDRHGSFVEFVYCRGEVSEDGATCTDPEANAWNGTKLLHYIRYTNRSGLLDGTFAVVFGHEARPDRIQGFHAGSSSRQTQRISRISTYRDFTGPAAAARGKLVRSYTLTYEPLEDSTLKGIRATNTSRLIQVQERDGDGVALPPLQFTLAPDTVFGLPVSHRPNAQTGTPRAPEGCGGVIGNRIQMQCP
jgi:hypothetical protein